MTTIDYRAIDCDRHSQLELFAMRRLNVTLEAVDRSGGALRLQGRVVDVVTRDRAEYLVLEDEAGGRIQVRLDRLRRIDTPEQETLWRQ